MRVDRPTVIRVVAPSGDHAARFPTRREAARRDLEANGFGVRIGEDVTRPRTERTDGDQRARALVAAFEDLEADVVMASVGGDDAIDLLPHLDIERIAATGKPLIGYSDTNVLQLACWSSHRVPAIVGPMLLCQFGDVRGCDPFTLASLRCVLDPHVVGRWVDLGEPGYRLPGHRPWGGPEEGKHRDPVPDVGPATVHTGEATGPMIASNVASLLALAGTARWPDLAGAVLLLEAAEGHSLDDLRVALVRLKSMGCLEDLVALGVGRFTATSDVRRDTLVAMLRDLVPASIPTVVDLPFGHVDPIVSLPFGAPCRVVADETVTIKIRMTSTLASERPAT
jgi:muramoyltetrapeptide carboxypeptidase